LYSEYSDGHRGLYILYSDGHRGLYILYSEGHRGLYILYSQGHQGLYTLYCILRVTKYVHIKSTTVYAPRRNWDSPQPSTRRLVCPLPPVSGGRGTLAGEKGVGRVPIPTKGIHCGTLYMYVLCAEGYQGLYILYSERSQGLYTFILRVIRALHLVF
jgi:hypothetical protein